MKKKFHIIGAGFAGLTSAVALSRSGHQVILYHDPCDKYAATPAAHGISTIKGLLESQTELFELKMQGHLGFEKYLSDLEKCASIRRPKDVWRQAVLEKFVSLSEFRKNYGRIFRWEFTGANRVLTHFKNSDDFAECLYSGDWWVDSDYYVEILKAACRGLGVEFLECAINNITYDDGLDLYRIESAKETYFADNVIVSAGAKTTSLIESFKLNLGPLFAVSGLTFKGETCLSDRCYVKGRNGITICNNKLFIGSTSDQAVSVNTDIDLYRSNDQNILEFENLLSQICGEKEKLPSIKINSINCRWGVRVRTKNRAPIFKTIEDRGSTSLTVNFGYYKSGIILSWLLAEKFAKELK